MLVSDIYILDVGFAQWGIFLKHKQCSWYVMNFEHEWMMEWMDTTIYSLFSSYKLEPLRSEDTPRRLMITHTIESYWIPSQKKTKSKLQI